MADKEELNEADDLFDANNPDDMSDFMNMLDGIDGDSSELEQEMEQLDTEQAERLLDEASDDLDSFGSSDDMFKLTKEEEEEAARKVNSMMSELGLSDEASAEDSKDEAASPAKEEKAPEKAAEEESAFVDPASDDILNLLDAVGEEEIPVGDVSAEELADESVGELADILSGVDSSGEGFISDGSDTIGVLEGAEEGKPKKGFIQRLIEKFKREPTEEELLEEAQEKEWEEQEAEAARVKKQEKAEQKAVKKEENDKKKQEKAEKKAAEKTAKDAEKAAKKAEKDAQKGIPIPKSQLVPVKPLLAFVIIGLAVSVVFVMFTNNLFYSSNVKDSKELFIHQKYKAAYEKLLGLDIKKKDQKFFEQVKTVRTIDKDLEAYNNYIEARDYELALQSLIKGIGKYGIQSEKAKELKLENEMHDIYEKLVKEITVRYGLTAQDAQTLYDMKDKKAYEEQIEKIARDASIRDGVSQSADIQEEK